MTELLNAAQMRAIENAAIESGAVSGLELMERAGRGVVEAMIEGLPRQASAAGGGAAPTPPGYFRKEDEKRVVVLCGPGNNGGDGFVVARLLKERGWTVEVFLFGDARKLPPDAQANHARWCALGEVRAMAAEAVRACEATVFVDAVFGTGLSRPVPEVVRQSLLAVAEKRAALVAVDLPSWLCSDSGRVLGGGRYPGCDLSVSFHRLKLGHVLADGPAACGRVVVADIGLTGKAAGAVELAGVEGQAAADLGKGAGHKYAHGHALILAGGPGHGGAARLAARGALRIGAGLVTLGCPHGALAENGAQLTAIMLRELGDDRALAEVLKDARVNALCLGPGLGVERSAGLVAVALGAGGVAPRPTVLDADALSALARDAALISAVHERCVLTPHAGEFARLFPDIAEKLAAPATGGPAYSKVDATRAAAARVGCVVLFKGADTVIAAPDGHCVVNSAAYERAAPWLATAGSGDVLAGFICGLLARGFAPMAAAEAGAWLHVECARRFGPGLIAEDLPEMLPAVFSDLGL